MRTRRAATKPLLCSNDASPYRVWGRRRKRSDWSPAAFLCGLALRLVAEELFVFGRTVQRGRRRLALLDGLRHGVEIAGADFALMLDRGEALFGRGEFGFLQFDERASSGCAHSRAPGGTSSSSGVEAGQRDELELVAHRAEFALELGDGRVVQVLLPVERRRAVVRQHLAGELAMDGFGKVARERQVGLAGFAPDQVDIRRIGQAARDRLFAAPGACGRSLRRCVRRSGTACRCRPRRRSSGPLLRHRCAPAARSARPSRRRPGAPP